VKPPGGHDFQLFGTLTGAAVATTPALVAPATTGTFLIPSANVGIIRSVVFLVNNILTTSSVLFSILYNRGGVEGWNQVPVLPRLASSVGSAYGPDETFLEVPENTAITVEIRVTDAAAYQVSMLAHGWFYPKEIHEAFTAGYPG